MNKLPFFLLLIFLSSSVGLLAQTVSDALRFSQASFGGTARSMGTGGAFTALGADFSSASQNPAGIALFRRNEVMISPAIFSTRTETNYLGNALDESDSVFSFNNLGIVTTRPLGEGRGRTTNWRSFNLAVSMNRLQNFSNFSRFSGFNTQNSITQFYAEDAQGATTEGLPSLAPFGGYLAFVTGIIDSSANNNITYFGVAGGGNILQEQRTTTEGALDEYAVTLAANYNDKWYFGLTWGIPIVRYTMEAFYEEVDTENNIANFNELALSERLAIRGSGINLKLGVTYRLNDMVRLGAAIHTPSLISLQEDFSVVLSSDFDNPNPGRVEAAQSPIGLFEYSLTTPWRYMVGGAFFIKRLGFISVDYELVNYAGAKFHFDGEAFQAIEGVLNQDIDNALAVASNIRLGAELALADIWRLRAGYALYGSPFANTDHEQRQNITGGFGIRYKRFILDLAYVHTISETAAQPYTLSNQAVPVVGFSETRSQLVMSIGWKL